MAVTHFVTQFKPVSRHFGVYSRKQKKFGRENYFENVVSDLQKKNLCPQKLLEKSAKTKKIKTKNHESVYNLWRTLGTKLVVLVDFWDNICKAVFSKHLCFFLFYTKKCLETYVNCVTKCVTAKICPRKVQILENICS